MCQNLSSWGAQTTQALILPLPVKMPPFPDGASPEKEGGGVLYRGLVKYFTLHLPVPILTISFLPSAELQTILDLYNLILINGLFQSATVILL